ncbi:MAG: ABC-2 family transporter protein [Bacillota bacterium]
MRHLRVLGGYIRNFFLLWLAWRSFAFTLAANQAVTPLIGLAVWSTALPGHRLTDYYVVMLIVRLLTVSYENHTFSNRIYNGELADELLRPHPVVLQPLGENLALRIWHLLIGLPLLLGLLLFVPLELRAAHLAWALPALLLAAVLRFLFTFALALTAFWTERAHSAVTLGGTLLFLLGGEAVPVPLLPPGLRPWATALPFRAMSGFPAELAVGQLGPMEALWGYLSQLIWLVLLAAICTAVWRAGVRRYTVVGG